jgi:hypothetical protein
MRARPLLRQLVTGLLAFAAALLILTTPALTQKPGGTLRHYQFDNPPSASLHEEVRLDK